MHRESGLLRGAETRKLIIKQKEIMPIIIDIRKDLRFQQGMEEGMQIKGNERNAAFVIYLLQHSSRSIEEIANLVNVPVEFVMDVKSGMK